MILLRFGSIVLIIYYAIVLIGVIMANEDSDNPWRVPHNYWLWLHSPIGSSQILSVIIDFWLILGVLQYINSWLSTNWPSQ